MYIAVTVIAAMLLGVGFVLQQHAAAKLSAEYLHLRLIAELLRKRIWVAGVAVMVMGQALSAWGLGHLSLTVSEPLLATNLIFALLLAAPISGEIPRKTEFIGALMLCLGVAILSASRSVRALSESFGSFSHWPAAGIIAGVAAVLVVIGRNGPSSLRATLTGGGAGLLLGIADGLTRRSVEILDGHGLVTLLTTWPGYAVIGTAAVGLWLVQSAFSVGPLHASLPAITGAEPLAGITLGVLVFGDKVHITPLLLAVQALGLATMVGGVILVARAPVFGKLHLRHLAQPADAGANPEPGTRDAVGDIRVVPAPTPPAAESDETERETGAESPRFVLSKMTLPKMSVPKVNLPSVTIPDLPVLSPSDATMAVPRLRTPWPRIPALKMSAVREAARQAFRTLLAKLTRLASSLRGPRRTPPAR
jgi:drug/metabolite transporter (DMT)-like permease